MAYKILQFYQKKLNPSSRQFYEVIEYQKKRRIAIAETSTNTIIHNYYKAAKLVFEMDNSIINRKIVSRISFRQKGNEC